MAVVCCILSQQHHLEALGATPSQLLQVSRSKGCKHNRYPGSAVNNPVRRNSAAFGERAPGRSSSIGPRTVADDWKLDTKLFSKEHQPQYWMQLKQVLPHSRRTRFLCNIVGSSSVKASIAFAKDSRTLLVLVFLQRCRSAVAHS